MWYIKKAELTPSAIQGQSKNVPPTINVIRQPIGLTNVKSTCYLNALIQMTFSFSPLQIRIMECLIESETELAKAMNQILTYFVEEHIVEMSSLQLANGLLQMKTLFRRCK